MESDSLFISISLRMRPSFAANYAAINDITIVPAANSYNTGGYEL